MITTDHLINSGEDLTPAMQAVTRFARVWPKVKQMASQATRLSGATQNLRVNVATTAGRTMITITPTGEEGLFVSLVADQFSEFPDGRMGLHAVLSNSMEEMIAWLGMVQENFPELQPDKSLRIS
jgi:hypothetical protein